MTQEHKQDETEYLLSNPANAERLNRAVDDINSGKPPAAVLSMVDLDDPTLDLSPIRDEVITDGTVTGRRQSGINSVRDVAAIPPNQITMDAALNLGDILAKARGLNGGTMRDRKDAQVYVFDALGGSRDMQVLCHTLADISGWWTDPKTSQPIELTRERISEKLLLVVTEIAEATEGLRKSLQDDKLPHREMLEVELADAIIRIYDLAGRIGLDVPGAMIEKLAYNQQRADHKLENRAKEGGKAF